MTATVFIIASFVAGYTLGILLEKHRSKKFIKESFVCGYKACNKKWINRNVEEARRKIERRKTHNEIGSR